MDGNENDNNDDRRGQRRSACFVMPWLLFLCGKEFIRKIVARGKSGVKCGMKYLRKSPTRVLKQLSTVNAIDPFSPIDISSRKHQKSLTLHSNDLL